MPKCKISCFKQGQCALSEWNATTFYCSKYEGSKSGFTEHFDEEAHKIRTNSCQCVRSEKFAQAKARPGDGRETNQRAISVMLSAPRSILASEHLDPMERVSEIVV